MTLKNRVAIVTGAGRGIGRAGALALARSGAHIVLAARSGGEIDAVAAEVAALGVRALPVITDVTVFEECQHLAKAAAEEFGRIDVLVNNAGGGDTSSRLVDSDPRLWADTVTLNLVSVFNVSRAVLPHMIEAGFGRVVNIGSGTGYSAVSGTSAYGAAKAGVAHLTRVLAQEVWRHGIDVNELVPGPVATRLTEADFTPGQTPRLSPSERVKEPEEVAELLLWLLERPTGGPTGQLFSLARRPL